MVQNQSHGNHHTNKGAYMSIKPATKKEYDLDNREDKAMYDDMLNEVYPVIDLGVTIYPSDALEQCDPIAYRTGFNDYTDSLDERWACPECGKEYDDEDEATYCCQEKEEEEETNV